MKYSEQQLNKWINAALKFNDVDKKIEDILREEKELYGDKRKPKEYQPYYLKYAWKSEEEEEMWLEYIAKQLVSLDPKLKDDKLIQEVSFIDMLLGLSGINIMKKAIEVKVDKVEQQKLF
jgi:hypothetical protein